jgi:hypothetical protein
MRANAATGTLLICAAAVSLTCGGGGGNGGPTGTPSANVVGHYSVTHAVFLGGVPAGSCPGELDITTQNDEMFSGTISISDTPACEAIASSGTISGTVTSGGSVMFTVTLSVIEDLLSAFGCVPVSGGETFTGTVTTTVLSATRTNQLQCTDGSGGDASYTISGPRT